MILFDHQTLPDTPSSGPARPSFPDHSLSNVEDEGQALSAQDAESVRPSMRPRNVTDLQRVRRALGAFYRELSLRVGEYVFGWRGRADIDVRIYTSIDKANDRFRDIGSDCVRIVVYDIRANRKINAWSCTLNRRGQLIHRLSEKAGAALLRASFRPRCPDCQQDSLVITPIADEPQYWVCDRPHCPGYSDLDA